MIPPNYKRPPALGPMRPEQMPKHIRRPADEPPLAGLMRFISRHFNPKDARPCPPNP